jgi:hypothetical protein
MSNPSNNKMPRSLAEQLFADLLVPQPKAKRGRPAGSKAPLEAHSFKPRAVPSNPVTSPFFAVEERQYFLVKQDCLTCGSRHEYAETKMLRYKAIKRRDGLVIEVPAIIPEALHVPSRILTRHETTDFCPACVEIASRIDSSGLFELESDFNPQIPLFN